MLIYLESTTRELKEKKNLINSVNKVEEYKY